MRLLLICLCLLGVNMAYSQNCQMGDFVDLKSPDLDQNYKIIANVITPNVTDKGVTDFNYTISDSGKALIQVALRQPLGDQDILEINVYDQNGVLQKLRTSNQSVQFFLDVRPGQMLRIEFVLKTGETTNDGFCLFHLIAVKPYVSR